jgi:hypothetical protein
MKITDGSNAGDVISLKDQFSLIKTWVTAKQFNQSPIKLSKIINSVFYNLYFFKLNFQ